MATNRERVIQCLKDHPRGLCVDCLSKKTGVSPRQGVFRIARDLEREFRLSKERRECPGGDGRVKNVYYLLLPQPQEPQGRPDQPRQENFLSEYLRRMEKMIDSIDPGSRGSPLAFRLVAQKKARPDCAHVFGTMLAINDLRISVVKKGIQLGPTWWEVVKAACRAVDEWWKTPPGVLQR